MSNYAIGDVQGCFAQLQRLLDRINFDAQKDRLWFAGDLVNRGPRSLETLRFIKNLPQVIIVLGNHDLHLLALAEGIAYQGKHTLDAVLAAEDASELLAWLRQQPLMYQDTELNYVMFHAGIIPTWSIDQALGYAEEVQAELRGKRYQQFLANMYGDCPQCWDNKLRGWSRLRFITNCFTRLRFCDRNGKLALDYKGKIGSQPSGYFPWFQLRKHGLREPAMLFGHWAAIQGKVAVPNIYGLDTGCVWGGRLTAMRLEDKKCFSCECQKL